jgi:hypothetical protein
VLNVLFEAVQGFSDLRIVHLHNLLVHPRCHLTEAVAWLSASDASFLQVHDHLIQVAAEKMVAKTKVGEYQMTVHMAKILLKTVIEL